MHHVIQRFVDRYEVWRRTSAPSQPAEHPYISSRHQYCTSGLSDRHVAPGRLESASSHFCHSGRSHWTRTATAAQFSDIGHAKMTQILGERTKYCTFTE